MRWLYLILIALLLAVPLAMRHSLAGRSANIAAGKDTPRLIVVTPHNQDIRREFARAFSRWHQQHYGTKVILDCRSIGGTNDIKRALKDFYDGCRLADGSLKPEAQAYSGYDMVWGGGDFFFNNELKPLGILKPLQKEIITQAIGTGADAYLAGSALYDVTKGKPDEPIRWVGVCLSSFGIVYNPDVMNAMGLPAPTQWKDLAAPQLSGAVALADPTHSGSAAVAYMMVLQRCMQDAEDEFFAGQPEDTKRSPRDKWPADVLLQYNQAIARGWKTGMRMMLLIAANSRYFTDSAERVPTDVGNGDAAIGMAIDFYGRVEEQIVGPTRAPYVSPKSGTPTSADAIAILYGATGSHLELANHFIEFLLSDEGQELWIKKPGTPNGPERRGLGRTPIVRSLYKDQSGWTDTDNPYEDAGTFNQRGEWMSTLGEVRPIWSAAWVDDRDSLHDAYRKILSVPDAEKRQRLLEELADLPIEYSDVLADHAARALAKAATEADRQKILRSLPSQGIDVIVVIQRADALAAAAKNGTSGVLDVKARMQWATKFREHYEAVAAKAK